MLALFIYVVTWPTIDISNDLMPNNTKEMQDKESVDKPEGVCETRFRILLITTKLFSSKSLDTFFSEEPIL